jgi:hypothetical protein
MSAKLLEIRAMAFISPQNYPILVRTFKRREDDELKFHYVAHTALDVIEERCEYQMSFLTEILRVLVQYQARSRWTASLACCTSWRTRLSQCTATRLVRESVACMKTIL